MDKQFECFECFDCFDFSELSSEEFVIIIDILFSDLPKIEYQNDED